MFQKMKKKFIITRNQQNQNLQKEINQKEKKV